MEKKVLIASSHQAFADLLRHSLTGGRKYVLKVALTEEDVQALTDQHVFDLVILDADLPDQPIVTAVANLKKQNESLKLIAFPPDNRADHPMISNLSADAFLKKPFYLPDLQDILESQLRQTKVISPESQTDLQEDSEAGRYQYILNLIMEESQAAAILLVKDNQPFAFVGDLDSNSPQHVMHIIMPHWNMERRSDVVRFKRLQEGGKDYLFYATALNTALILVVVFERTISLTSARLHTSAVLRQLKNPPAIWMVNQSQHLIQNQQPTTAEIKPSAEAEPAYPTTDDLDWVDEDEDLDLLDEAEMINLEALLASMPTPDPDGEVSVLPESFMDQWQQEPVQKTVDEPKEPQNGNKPDRDSLVSEELWEKEEETIDPELESWESLDQVQEPFDPLHEKHDYEQEETLESDPLADLVFPWDEQETTGLHDELSALEIGSVLEEIPNEALYSMQLAAESFAETSNLNNQKNEGKRSSFSKFESAETSDVLWEDFPALLAEVATSEEQEEPEAFEKQIKKQDGQEDQPSYAALEPTQIIRRDGLEFRTIPADLPPTNPLEDTAPRLIKGASKPALEPNTAGVSSLNYTSVLLPRFPKQFLAGEIAENLGEWLPQLCVAYGWRLERISIRPQYIQWTVQVPPAVSPGYMVRILREETSRRIFKMQPELKADNPLNDFWAPGYLVMSGFLPPTQQMLVDYIHQTRRRQGLELQDD